mgnify:FL=1
MDSMIKEINDNLKTIIDTIRENRDSSLTTLDNIQNQMDKKVEEAKKYKIQVDEAKERINDLEQENKSLELSLKELQDKYSKMNLVSIIEAGNREIKSKINDNLISINKEKEHIQEFTNRARTIKDLLINLKKDKTLKEEKLESIKVVYEYYNTRINEVIDYAFDHSNNLADYKDSYNKIGFDDKDTDSDKKESKVVKPIDLENTMVFDEIANIDENKNFKDEMSFINDKIENETKDTLEEKPLEEKTNFSDEEKYNAIINDTLNNINDEGVVDNKLDKEEVSKESEVDKEENNTEDVKSEEKVFDKPVDEKLNIDSNNIFLDNEDEKRNSVTEEIDTLNKDRIDKINDLFSNINDVKDETVNTSNNAIDIENKIDNAYKDVFGTSVSEPISKTPTLTDIFGNPIKAEDLSTEVKTTKMIEDLFRENGIEFNRFREDEKNYLKQIYDEEKFNNIIEVLKRNKINIENIYYAFNIFGEISPNELESLINKLLSIGQSVEAIGSILEKLPKVKKYNLDEAIMSYGDYIKDIDITELVMKAKELYDGGNK